MQLVLLKGNIMLGFLQQKGTRRMVIHFLLGTTRNFLAA